MPRNYAWQDHANGIYATHTFPVPSPPVARPNELFMLNATPGAGKTRCTLRMVDHDLTSGLSERTIICTPSIHICDQWQEVASEQFNMELLRNVNWDNLDILPNYKGIVITYASMFKHQGWLKTYCRYYNVTLVLDELHYLGTEMGWGTAALNAFALVPRKIALTGTLWRTDEMDIPWVEYENGKAKAQVKYSYAEAVRDEVNRQLSFPSVDGYAEWEIYSRRFGRQLSEISTRMEAECAIKAVLTVPEWEDGNLDALKKCWVFQMLTESTKKLRELRGTPELANSAALFVAMDIEHAKTIKKLLLDFFHIDAELIHSQEPDAKQKLKAFKTSDRKALVAVDMVTEGVDIQRFRVLGWATNKTTELKIDQLTGRIKRPEFDEGDDHCWCFWPQVEPFNTYAIRVLEVNDRVRKEKEEAKNRAPESAGPKDRNFRPISSTGERGDTTYNGVVYSPEEMDFAAQYRVDNPCLKKLTMEEVAGFLHDQKDDFGRTATTEDDDSDGACGFGTLDMTDFVLPKSTTRRPLEERIKIESNKCHEKAKRLAGKLIAIRGGDFPDVLKSIHADWKRMPGNHWQSEPMITEEELKRKSVWLDNHLRRVDNAS